MNYEEGRQVSRKVHQWQYTQAARVRGQIAGKEEGYSKGQNTGPTTWSESEFPYGDAYGQQEQATFKQSPRRGAHAQRVPGKRPMVTPFYSILETYLLFSIPAYQ